MAKPWKGTRPFYLSYEEADVLRNLVELHTGDVWEVLLKYLTEKLEGED